MLPDLIDKPMGQFLFQDTFSNGRIFGHTLLFSALILIASIILYYSRRRSTGLLCLPFGSIMHLILDGMWLTPSTLLWPLYGWQFEKVDLSGGIEARVDSTKNRVNPGRDPVSRDNQYTSSTW